MYVIFWAFVGALAGRAFRSVRVLRHAGAALTVTVGLMLFVLGVSVGSNRQVMGNVWRVGFDGVVLGGSAALGSAVAAALLCRLWGESRHEEGGRGKKQREQQRPADRCGRRLP